MISNITTQGIRYALAVLAIVAAGGTPGAATIPYPNITSVPDDHPQQEKWYQLCLQVRAENPPPADQDLPPKAEQLKGCSATDLYYDAWHADSKLLPNWRQVRQCAFATKDFGVLMMLYANGEGVHQNLKLATRYACSLDSAVAEMEGRVKHLNERSGNRVRAHFDQCDDITSGYMQGICAAIQERQQEKLRETQLAAIVKNWHPAEQLALQVAKEKLRDFVNLRAEDETDLSGTARAALQIEAQSEEYDQFLHDIKRLGHCRPPQRTVAAAGTSDQQLQRLLQVVTNPQRQYDVELGTIEPNGIQRTQQAWQAYRDAWRRLVVTKCPDADARPWLATLAARRLAQLSAFLPAHVKNR